MNTPVTPASVIVRDGLVPPAIGRIVDYVLSEKDSMTAAGAVRPAIVVSLVADGSEHGVVNLMVFTDAGADQLQNTHHAKSVQHDEDQHAPGTWHWPSPRELVFKNVPMSEGPGDEPPPPAPEVSAIDAYIAKKGYAVAEATPSDTTLSNEPPPPAPSEPTLWGRKKK